MSIKPDKQEIFLINTFRDLNEGFILVDDDKNILNSNTYIESMLGKVKTLFDIEHLFNFDVCILKGDDILTYTPLNAAFSSQEEFKTECLLQVSINKYKKVIIKSFQLLNSKAFFISNISDELENIEMEKRLKGSALEIEKLQKKQYGIL